VDTEVYLAPKFLTQRQSDRHVDWQWASLKVYQPREPIQLPTYD